MKRFVQSILLVVTTSSSVVSLAQEKDTITKEKNIEEVVIVGFGKQKTTSLTSSVSVVSEKALEGRPVNNVVEALKGVAPGLNFNIGTGGGELNNSSSFSLRGAGTIGNTSSAPLVLIDGMEGDPARLNPRDVESVSILKDASAASIYGSRAAFGVVLITTKSGKKGKPVVTYDLMQRFSNPILRPRILDSESFANYFNEAAINSGGVAIFNEETLQKIRDYKNGLIPYETSWNPSSNGGQGNWNMYTTGFANNDWFKIFYRNWVPAMENNVSVRGGGDRSTYYFSANYLDQDGLARINPDKLRRYTINGKIKVDVLPYLSLSYNSRFIRSDYNRSAYMNGLFYHNIARRWPTVPLKDPNGNTVFGNEIAQLEGSFFKNQQDFLDQQLVFVFSPIKGWDTNVEFNYKIENFTEIEKYTPINRYDEEGNMIFTNYGTGSAWDVDGGSVLRDYYWKTGFFNTNIYSTYSTTLNNVHHLKAMLGMQAELYKARNFYASRNRLLSSELWVLGGTTGEEDFVNGSALHWSTFGTFGRFNYDFDRRYLFEFNLRLDASSRFLRDQRWRWYPSVSVGWNVARESFWNDGVLGQAIKEFKLRASYGKLGNQNTTNYYPFFLNQPFTVQGGRWLINEQYPNIASAPGMVSANLTWENVETKNFGLDITALRNRLSIKADYFIRNTLGSVGAAPELPGVLGISAPAFNNSDLRTRGFELQLSWRDKIGENFNYGITGTISDAQTEITKFNNPTNALGQYYVGRKFGEIWGLTTHGIAKTDQEMQDWLAHTNQSRIGQNWAAGDVMYKDLDGDGIIGWGSWTLGDSGDYTIIGNNTPRYNFGVNIDLQYKNFDLSMLLQGVGKRDFYLGSDQPYFVGANNNMWQAAAFVEHLDYFRPENTTSPFGPNVNSYYPRPLMEQGSKNFETQTRWLQNAAYVRLKNLQIGYTLSRDLMSILGISNMRIYISGENLVTWTKLSKIFDPETINGAYGSGKVYPLSKVISTGVTVNF